MPDPIIIMLLVLPQSTMQVPSALLPTQHRPILTFEMSSSTESKEIKDSDNVRPGKENKKPTELPQYVYKPLSKPDALRLLRLIPANDEQQDVDCRIIEVELPKNVESPGNATEHQKKMKAASNEGESELPPSTDLPSLMTVLDNYEIKDEEKPNFHGEKDEEKEEISSDEKAKVREDKAPKTNTSYEAVSWCWGREPANEVLRVHEGDNVFAFSISKNLKMALWALRTNDEVRQLWIDAICINQKDTKERNEQVPRMDRIYGGAENVCIWLGEESADSKMAMDFIRERVLELWKFDQLIENRNLAKNWAALIRLMKRPWFSRRWVVQEIALSPRGGTLYCGKDSNSWQDFADAVSLFVEVESATHRLSDVMKLDQSFGNIPNFFGDVSSLGAALLVDATSNLFRNSMTGERMPLSSLEFLVSRLSVFEATQPRDTIYALLAISKETTPQNVPSGTGTEELTRGQKAALKLAPKGGFANKAYNVDYRLPVIDVYQEFVEFAIRKAEKKRALDILCRAWAPTVMKSHDDPSFLKPAREKDKEYEVEKWKKHYKTEHKKAETRKGEEEEEKDQEIPLPSWIPGLSGAAFEMEEHPTAGLRMERQNADPLVGLPDETGRRNYTAAGDLELDIDKLEFRKWTTLKKPNSSYPEYSMFVRGFILDQVATVEHLAANGNIPYRWLTAGGWFDTDKNPPDDFWRTLVADRAQNGHNPPTYFPRACKESMRYKAKTMSKTRGYVDCRKLIEEGRCTIVAQFLRRVQEVIWNRQLMRTSQGRLGLVRDDVSPGFKVCILYGCSVPVILQEFKKSPAELKAELIDRYNQWYSKVKVVVAFCEVRYMLEKKRKRKLEESREMERRLSNVAGNRRRAKGGTWPVMTTTNNEELAELKMSSEPLERRKSSLEPIPEGSQAVVRNKLGSSDEAASREALPPPKDNEAPTSPLIAPTLPLKEDVTSITERTFPSLSNPLHQTRSSDSISLKSASSAAPQDSITEHETKKVDAPRLKSDKDKQDELEEGARLFEARKREQKKRVAQEVLKNLSFYRLVGECYVHGMMNGEAIKRQNEEHIPQQVFELR
jgi:Heterokaryon incompatibility protein (HET)